VTTTQQNEELTRATENMALITDLFCGMAFGTRERVNVVPCHAAILTKSAGLPTDIRKFAEFWVLKARLRELSNDLVGAVEIFEQGLLAAAQVLACRVVPAPVSPSLTSARWMPNPQPSADMHRALREFVLRCAAAKSAAIEAQSQFDQAKFNSMVAALNSIKISDTTAAIGGGAVKPSEPTAPRKAQDVASLAVNENGQVEPEEITWVDAETQLNAEQEAEAAPITPTGRRMQSLQRALSMCASPRRYSSPLRVMRFEQPNAAAPSDAQEEPQPSLESACEADAPEEPCDSATVVSAEEIDKLVSDVALQDEAAVAEAISAIDEPMVLDQCGSNTDSTTEHPEHPEPEHKHEHEHEHEHSVARSTKRPKVINELKGTDKAPTTLSSVVLLTPIRVAPREQEAIGNTVALTPVRRSTRITKDIANGESDDVRGAPLGSLLFSTGFAYTPNVHLREAAQSISKTSFLMSAKRHTAAVAHQEPKPAAVESQFSQAEVVADSQPESASVTMTPARATKRANLKVCQQSRL